MLLLLLVSLAAAQPWKPVLGEPVWVAPNGRLPAGLKVQPSNNNVAIALHDGRLYLAWRTAPTHFASSRTQLHVVSSGDLGRTWALEQTISLGADVREPLFLSMAGRLTLFFMELGKDPMKFEPQAIWRQERLPGGGWAEREQTLDKNMVPWEIKQHGGRAYLASYKGNHYDLGGESKVELRMSVSDDGRDWKPLDDAPIHVGGVSELGFEFDGKGAVWGVGRNEDGDRTGFGALIVRRDPEAGWQVPETSDPNRYDSPRMFEHEGELYLVARRDVGGPFDRFPEWLPFPARRTANLLSYWRRPKRTALYRLDRETRAVEHLLDLPSAGDTAFPSVARTGPHSFLIANYTSPLDGTDPAWVQGQISPKGTGIYLIELSFRP